MLGLLGTGSLVTSANPNPEQPLVPGVTPLLLAGRPPDADAFPGVPVPSFPPPDTALKTPLTSPPSAVCEDGLLRIAVARATARRLTLPKPCLPALTTARFLVSLSIDPPPPAGRMPPAVPIALRLGSPSPAPPAAAGTTPPAVPEPPDASPWACCGVWRFEGFVDLPFLGACFPRSAGVPLPACCAISPVGGVSAGFVRLSFAGRSASEARSVGAAIECAGERPVALSGAGETPCGVAFCITRRRDGALLDRAFSGGHARGRSGVRDGADPISFL
jgi:hypothetical protein